MNKKFVYQVGNNEKVKNNRRFVCFRIGETGINYFAVGIRKMLENILEYTSYKHLYIWKSEIWSDYYGFLVLSGAVLAF